MMKQKVESALNNQMNREKGLAHWMRIQSQEEHGHAMKFYGHLIEREGKAMLQPIEAPPSKWESPEKIFKDAYQHEQKVTKSINDLVELAKAEKDHPAELFLQWLVKEQVEEEVSANEITQKLHMIGEYTSALLILDSELGRRSPSKE